MPSDSMMSESSSMVNVQYMTTSGSWVTTYVVMNHSVNISQAMNMTSNMFPKARVRAVDSKTGRMVDML